ncbi:hypothetical protein AWC04_14005 [Mycolicibacterium fallax]|uniref:Uncharacterized protein n=1 Tax=Mycolicibacterium fallax TaxID=1793 RepID=A0A1X1R878_MYCFA|nr:hypothetical protein AWC04_14005 [Mycolicibacterium fallax]
MVTAALSSTDIGWLAAVAPSAGLSDMQRAILNAGLAVTDGRGASMRSFGSADSPVREGGAVETRGIDGLAKVGRAT